MIILLTENDWCHICNITSQGTLKVRISSTSIYPPITIWTFVGTVGYEVCKEWEQLEGRGEEGVNEKRVSSETPDMWVYIPIWCGRERWVFLSQCHERAPLYLLIVLYPYIKYWVNHPSLKKRKFDILRIKQWWRQGTILKHYSKEIDACSVLLPL